MPRKPNTTCHRCGKPLYRQPSTLTKGYYSYCSKGCQSQLKTKDCAHCGKPFTAPESLKQRKYCSNSCSNKARRGISYTGSKLIHNKARLLIELSSRSGCNHCMVEGCHYSRTLDVHRLNPGKFGGSYALENSFALCPNHHAELHRGVVALVPTGEFRLQAIETGVISQLSKYTTPSKKVSAQPKSKKKPSRQRRVKVSKTLQTTCAQCGKDLTLSLGRGKPPTKCYCSKACSIKRQEKAQWPSLSDLTKLVWKYPVSNVARRLQVSGVAVKKRCKRLGVLTPPRGYWAKQRTSR
jgi:endogenous inhibitor of DNA gyrase (YacG/DUF329 family)